MSEGDETTDGMERGVRLTDRIGITGLTTDDFADAEHQVTSVSVKELKRAVDILDTLDWDDVDVGLVEPFKEGADQPLLVLRPTPGALFGDSDAAVCVAPLSEMGRTRSLGEGEDDG